jgi:hypothetical protein
MMIRECTRSKGPHRSRGHRRNIFTFMSTADCIAYDVEASCKYGTTSMHVCSLESTVRRENAWRAELDKS